MIKSMTALLAWMAIANSSFAEQPDDRCYAEGAAITVTGTAAPRRLPLANGGVSEVWLLMLDRPLCVLGADDGDLSRAKNVSSLQIVGQRPPINARMELDGRLTTVNVTQSYAVPVAIVVSAGRKVKGTVAEAAQSQDYRPGQTAELLKRDAATADDLRAKPQENSADLFELVSIVVLIISIYFLPTIAAVSLGHHNKDAICILNLFLGWTFIGWVAALVWASTSNREA